MRRTGVEVTFQLQTCSINMSARPHDMTQEHTPHPCNHARTLNIKFDVFGFKNHAQATWIRSAKKSNNVLRRQTSIQYTASRTKKTMTSLVQQKQQNVNAITQLPSEFQDFPFSAFNVFFFDNDFLTSYKAVVCKNVTS